MLSLVLYPSPDLPKAALRILSNMTFLFVSLSYTAECAIVTAFITFIPKFIESQFGIPASNASIYTGKSLLVAFCFLIVVLSLRYHGHQESGVKCITPPQPCVMKLHHSCTVESGVF